MKFTKLVPNIFYTDIRIGLRLFAECLEFEIGYDDLKSEHPFCVLEKDGLAFHLIQSKEFAEKDRPEIRLETTDIEEVFRKVNQGFADLLHPNSKEIVLKPWKAKEFALRDDSGVCVIIQQWVPAHLIYS